MDFSSLKPPRVLACPEGMVHEAPVQPLNHPYWIAFNEPLAAQMGVPVPDDKDTDALNFFSGSLSVMPHPPVASVYAGHQFGVWVRQLGDGRAVYVGDWVDANGARLEWQLKGAGVTPFSRHADGRAVLRSSIREYLCSEAMHALGIPTTRALALTGSNDSVYRETVETSAIVTRAAPSFLRFGHFEFLAHNGYGAHIPALLDPTIATFFPDCLKEAEPYAAWFDAVCQRTASLVAAWQAVGFNHGVLNTDNCSILGLTLDYGPFGFLDGFDAHHICNHSDTQGRYRFDRQPGVMQWNLAALARALSAHIPEATLIDSLNAFSTHYETAYLGHMRAKLGLNQPQDDDAALINHLLDAMQAQNIDYTLHFRRLSEFSIDFRLPESLKALWPNPAPLKEWLHAYQERLKREPDPQRAQRMNAVNPVYVLRNHLAQNAIAAAQTGDFNAFTRLAKALREPFTEQAEFIDYAQPAPAWASELSVSCSS